MNAKRIAILLLLFAPRAHADEFSTISNIHGQTIKAIPVAMTKDWIFLKKEDGKTYRVQANQFSPQTIKDLQTLKLTTDIPQFEGRAELEAAWEANRQKRFRQAEYAQRQAQMEAIRQDQARYRQWLSQFPVPVQQAILKAEEMAANGNKAEAGAYLEQFIFEYQQAEALRIQREQQIQIQREQLLLQQELNDQLNQLNWNLQQLYR